MANTSLLAVTAKDIELYKRLLGYLKPYRKRFLLGLLATIPAAMLSGAIALVLGNYTDRLIQSQNYALLFVIPLAVMAFTVLEGVFSYVSSYYSSHVGTSISQDVRLQLYERLASRDLKYLNSSTPGQLMSRYYSDPVRLQQAVVNNLQTLVLESISVVALTAVLLYRSWEFALVALAIISLIVIPIAIIGKKLRRLDDNNQTISAAMYDVFNESIFGSRVIALFELESYQMKRFRKSMDDYFGNAMSLVRAEAILKPLMQFISAVGIALIFFFGTMRLQSGEMTPGELTSFLVALVLLYKPVKNVGGILSKLQRIFAPAERVFEKLDMPTVLVEPEKPIQVETFESLAFEGVDFAYRPDKPILKNINFSVKQGEVLALVGGSGGGKSTLVDLIPRFMDPNSGRVLLNGHDLRMLSLSSIRHLTSMVSQETLLFDGTMLDNIRLGRLSASEADVEQAIEVAHLKPVIADMPEGLNTRIGHRGVLLSGGQKQRIAIARAFLKNAPLLILDEATSALDNESEAAVQDGMMSLMKGKTVIVIAHRLSTIRHADRILVVEQGEVVEDGSHEELMASPGIYSRLYNLQFRHEKQHAAAS